MTKNEKEMNDELTMGMECDLPTEQEIAEMEEAMDAMAAALAEQHEVMLEVLQEQAALEEELQQEFREQMEQEFQERLEFQEEMMEQEFREQEEARREYLKRLGFDHS